ncbi:hypothetical protein JYU34_014737 [Plutella xylostella]|uniref:RNA 3'-terminal phosphate cyclase n=1 Tax=Plutella xylostella TaxID=51655 RepID=A0ABQ7Q9C3_PLUXY|nr:hypothetical protein JYU34_014737 [Plutella xylostella]
MSNFIDIDGSVLEGGGQILRMSVAFSAIMGVPVRVSRIRAGRSKPGLAAQHLKGIQLVGEMCGAALHGVEIGSTEIQFSPGQIKGGHYVADTKTAGSISLLLQVALPVALLADGPVTLELKGGTNADMAPQVDYLTEVFRPLLEKFGATFDFDLHRRGYYPRGGGHVTVHIRPAARLSGVELTGTGRVQRVQGWSFVAGTLPVKMAHEMAAAARQELACVCRDIHIECYKEDRAVASDNCSGIILVAETSSGCILGADALGRRGAGAGAAGRAAGAALAATVTSGACVDEHAQDQLIMFMSLAAGRSSVRVADVTLHTQTAMHVAKTIAKVHFNVVPSGDTNIIECDGLGITNNNIPPR